MNKEDREAFLNREVNMTKKEVLAATKKFHELSIEEIKELKKMPAATIQDEMKYLQPKL